MDRLRSLVLVNECVDLDSDYVPATLESESPWVWVVICSAERHFLAMSPPFRNTSILQDHSHKNILDSGGAGQGHDFILQKTNLAFFQPWRGNKLALNPIESISVPQNLQ